jgi:hypothetical protein
MTGSPSAPPPARGAEAQQSLSPTPPGNGGHGPPSRLSRRQALGLLAGGALAVGAAAAGIVAVRREGPPEPYPVPADTAGLPPTVDAPIGLPALPARCASIWINAFERPTVRELPADVLDTINLVVFAMAQSDEPGTGRLHWAPSVQSRADVAQDIDELVARDRPVLLGIGGADDGGITLTEDQHVLEFTESIGSLAAEFGFTGIDVDLEPSGSTWTEEHLVAAVRAVKAEQGAGFLVGLTVSMYGEHTDRWLSLARELGSDYDYWAPMLYDFAEAHDERLVPVAMQKIKTAVDAGVPTEKQILGFMCNAYYNTSPVEVTAQVWRTAVAEYPDLRGAFIWESKIERAHDFEWTRDVGNMLRAGQ